MCSKPRLSPCLSSSCPRAQGAAGQARAKILQGFVSLVLFPGPGHAGRSGRSAWCRSGSFVLCSPVLCKLSLTKSTHSRKPKVEVAGENSLFFFFLVPPFKKNNFVFTSEQFCGLWSGVIDQRVLFSSRKLSDRLPACCSIEISESFQSFQALANEKAAH